MTREELEKEFQKLAKPRLTAKEWDELDRQLEKLYEEKVKGDKELEEMYFAFLYSFYEIIFRVSEFELIKKGGVP